MTKEQREYEVTFSVKKGSTSERITTKVCATSDADAFNKAKIKQSVHREGKNYQVIAGACIKMV